MWHSPKIIDRLVFGLNRVAFGIILTQNRNTRHLQFVTLPFTVRLDPGTLQFDRSSSRKPSSILADEFHTRILIPLLLNLLGLQHSLQRIQSGAITKSRKRNLFLLPHRPNPSMHFSILNWRVSSQNCGYAVSPGTASLCRTRGISPGLPEQLRITACRPPCPHACQLLQVTTLNGA